MLNPARHTRIFYKLARTQRELGYRVSVIGQDEAPAVYTAEGVRMVPLAPFPRSGWRRWTAGFRILRLALRQRADIYVIHTPELLPAAWLLKRVWKKNLLYDVHEDYRANILAGQHYPAWLRRPLAWLARKAERRAVRWLDGISYAEPCYDNMLNAPEVSRVVLRNSFKPIDLPDQYPPGAPQAPYLLMTGNLSEAWGALDAMDFWTELCQKAPIPFVMAGFAHDSKLPDTMRKRAVAAGLGELFTLIGGNSYVPYTQILNLIRHCACGLALYAPAPHLQEKIPTKFFEYMAAGKPLIYRPTPYWEKLDAQWGLGAPWRRGEKALTAWQRIMAWQKTNRPAKPAWYSWDYTEAPALRDWLQRTTGSAS